MFKFIQGHSRRKLNTKRTKTTLLCDIWTTSGIFYVSEHGASRGFAAIAELLVIVRPAGICFFFSLLKVTI